MAEASDLDMTIIIGTIIFIILWFAGSIVIYTIAARGEVEPKVKAEYRGMCFSLTFIGCFCMWLMWVCVYLHQKNPLIKPILKSDTVDF